MLKYCSFRVPGGENLKKKVIGFNHGGLIFEVISKDFL